MQKDHLVSLLKCRLWGPNPRHTDSISQIWGPEIYIFKITPGDVKDPIFRNIELIKPELQIKVMKGILRESVL